MFVQWAYSSHHTGAGLCLKGVLWGATISLHLCSNCEVHDWVQRTTLHRPGV